MKTSIASEDNYRRMLVALQKKYDKACAEVQKFERLYDRSNRSE